MEQQTIENFIKQMNFIKAMGGTDIVVAELGHAVHQQPVAVLPNRPVFTGAQWKAMIDGLHTLGKLAVKYGMRLCYHHHVGTGVQQRSEVDRLMADTDPRLVHLLSPYFEQILVADHLKDGYWLEPVDVDGDGKPDLVASGLALGEVVWYKNPNWEKYPITKFPLPVAMDHADIDGDGRMDLVVCHDYGTCMYHCKPEDGKISWLRNPGQYSTAQNWEVHPLTDLMATHRLRLGHFTQTRTLELLALPVVGTVGVHEPVRVMLYPAPANILDAKVWDGISVDYSSFRIIHDVAVGKFASKSGSDLDSVLLASEEGITWLYFGPDRKWHTARLGSGELTEVGETGFKGTGNLAPGRIGDDPYAYIATVEPFHGNTVAVYSSAPIHATNDAGASSFAQVACKEKNAIADLTGVTWKRTILDVFGDPNQAGEGAGHHVVAADFDGDGDDEFLVALRGPMPWQGVFYYKAVDAKNGLFVKTRVSSSSAARIAVADFDGDGRLDFATTGYYTPGYFLADNPQILVFLNKFGQVPPERS